MVPDAKYTAEKRMSSETLSERGAFFFVHVNDRFAYTVSGIL